MAPIAAVAADDPVVGMMLTADGSTLLTALSVTFYVILGIAVFIILVGLFFCWMNKRADADFEDHHTYRELEDGAQVQPRPQNTICSTGTGGVALDKPDKRVVLNPIKKTRSKPLPAKVKEAMSPRTNAATNNMSSPSTGSVTHL
ncbi:Aste57867_1642 [Aphanomyces stellatus]|uniref:Aste57867_1642 protein n=1 Tax=Aphanomyces stellatus TaxID=120398 RepID=A0A485K5L4_9STRA|nr:hypothetical protein As57867_001640 [Aphanomyces stellatus]VFT78855.1 Aste57867_1642 [Aphanomyces stellatus]